MPHLPRASILVCALALAILAGSLPAIAPASVPTFGTPVQLPSSGGYGEPSVNVSPNGTVYVAAPGSHTSVWRSLNNPTSFTKMHDSGGSSGDSDVTTDANGRLYVSDLFNNVPVSVSTNGGSSYLTTVSTASGGSIDRQWTAAHGNGNVFSVWRDGSTERIAVSHDGGLTYTSPRGILSNVGLQGNILATSDNDLWIPYTSGSFLMLARSSDAGLTWSSSQVAPGANTLLFPAVARDANGTVYVAWSIGTGIETDSTTVVNVATSHDGGVTFGAPVRLSQLTAYNVFPWIAADKAGHVAVVWYEGIPPANLTVDPNAASVTPWYVHVALSTDADTATPSWVETRATGVVHTGPICTMGTACFPVSNPAVLNRELLDFFEEAELLSGNLVISYAGDTNSTGAVGLFVVVQNGGSNLKV